MDTLVITGRIIFGGFFIYSGVNHFIVFEMTTQYAKMKGVRFPAFAQAITGLMSLLGGLSIVLGFYPLVGIVLLVVFLVPVSFMMHNFWKIKDPQLRMVEKIDFMKNMALLGAVLMLLAIPMPWAVSLTP